MKFPPTYTITSVVKQSLYELDILKSSYELQPISPEKITSLRRASLLKSSLYSARIEGNPLEFADIVHVHVNDRDRHKIEVNNLVSAYEQLQTLVDQSVSTKMLKSFMLVFLTHFL